MWMKGNSNQASSEETRDVQIGFIGFAPPTGSEEEEEHLGD